jgi:hypothetical protein
MMQYKQYEITTFESGSGTWQAVISRSDGKPITCQGTTLPRFTIDNVASEEYAIQLAKSAIDTGQLS